MELKDYISEAISSKSHNYDIDPGELKVGDKVRVKSWKEIMSMCDQSNKDLPRYWFEKNGRKTYLLLNTEMRKMAGKVFTVSCVYGDNTLVSLEPDGNYWAWHPHLLERV